MPSSRTGCNQDHIEHITTLLQEDQAAGNMQSKFDQVRMCGSRDRYACKQTHRHTWSSQYFSFLQGRVKNDRVLMPPATSRKSPGIFKIRNCEPWMTVMLLWRCADYQSDASSPQVQPECEDISEELYQKHMDWLVIFKRHNTPSHESPEERVVRSVIVVISRRRSESAYVRQVNFFTAVIEGWGRRWCPVKTESLSWAVFEITGLNNIGITTLTLEGHMTSSMTSSFDPP